MNTGMHNAGPVSHEMLGRIERFLYEDAALLDRRDYAGWWKTLDDDIQYEVFAAVNRDASIGSLEFSLTSERAVELRQRVDQISTPRLTHAENPPSITRRLVANVMANQAALKNQFEVVCSLLVYKVTIDVPEGAIYSGWREDIIREVDGEFRLARRVVHLDQSIMFGAVSILF